MKLLQVIALSIWSLILSQKVLAVDDYEQLSKVLATQLNAERSLPEVGLGWKVSILSDDFLSSWNRWLDEAETVYWKQYGGSGAAYPLFSRLYQLLKKEPDLNQKDLSEQELSDLVKEKMRGLTSGEWGGADLAKRFASQPIKEVMEAAALQYFEEHMFLISSYLPATPHG